MQIRSFPKVPFETPGKKSDLFFLYFGFVSFPNENILFMDNRIIRQYFERL